jgi:hypothetical protein
MKCSGAELVAKSEDLNLKRATVAEQSQNGRKQRLRKRKRAEIDVRGATPQLCQPDPNLRERQSRITAPYNSRMAPGGPASNELQLGT